MSELRHIAIHVVESTPSRFSWVLSEIASNRNSLTPLQRARRPEATYHAAMAAGLLVLQEMVTDLAIGPRTQQGHESAEQELASFTMAPSEKPGAPKRPPKKIGGFFGFGPVR